MKKALKCFSLIIASLLVIAAFITTATYAQLTVAVLFYPLLILLIFKAFPSLTQSFPPEKPVVAIPPTVKSVEKVETLGKETAGIADFDKRTFLKLIGGAGFALFLFSLFNRRAENPFFKSLPALGSVSLEDTTNNKIDPALRQPTDGYNISEIDDSIIAYYGFTNRNGAWFIMKEDANTGSVRYVRADSNFPENWANRENLKYDYFDNTF